MKLAAAIPDVAPRAGAWTETGRAPHPALGDRGFVLMQGTPLGGKPAHFGAYIGDPCGSPAGLCSSFDKARADLTL